MTMRNWAAAAVLLAGLAGGTLASPVQAAPAAAGIDPAGNKALCDQLALALTPDSIIPIQIDSILGEMGKQILASDTTMAEMEAAYPGLVDAVTSAMRPIMLRSVMRMMPAYRADVSAFYCTKMTRTELTSAVAFMTSPDGQALVTQVNQKLEFKDSVGALAAEEEPSLDQLHSDKRRAAAATINSMPPDQLARIGAFSQTPTGRKMASLSRERSALDQKWFMKSDPQDDAAMEEAVITAMIDHIAKTDPATAKRMEAMLRRGDKGPKRD